MRGIRNPDQCPLHHHRTPINKVSWVPAVPTGQPRLPHHPSGGKRVKRLAWREWRNVTLERGTQTGRPHTPGQGPQPSRLCCQTTPPSGLRSRREIYPEPREKDRFGGKGRKERETEGRFSLTPWHATIWFSAS
ncbi:hypothetical protein ROHU_002861 [Labeo rohita]|uniref:Uncharacterized protein n=1 Tax=Labeo rohita TaxID=84645 RepID=A0A498NWI8_LABRO|nr:hypothetical protein ROHU_002861 [Labeo rohita]